MALRGGLVFDGLQELPAKLGELRPAFFGQQVMHVGRKRVDKVHLQVIADGMDVVVSGVIKEVNGGRERSGVLSGKGRLGATFKDELDKAFIVRVDDEDIQGKAPEHGI